MEQLSTITPEKFKEMKLLAHKIFGVSMYNSDNWDVTAESAQSKTYEYEDIGDAGKCILSNMLLAAQEHDIKSSIASTASQNASNKTNDYGSDFSKNFDYYAGKEMAKDYSGGVRIKQLGNYGRNTYSAQELSDKITSQLNETSSYSLEYCNKVRKYYQKKAQAANTSVGALVVADDLRPDRTLTELLSSNNPMKDVLFNLATSISSNIPASTTSPNWKKNLIKRMKYVPFDENYKHGAKQPKTTVQNSATLLKARKELLARAMGTLATEDEKTSAEMRKDLIKRFDYEPGEKTPDGTVVRGKMHTGPKSRYGEQRALFNSRFFAVKNSIWEERFKKRMEEMKSKGLDPKCYTPMDLFHGCSRESAGSIIGRDKGWFVNGEGKMAGNMLGGGAYFGFKAGKSSVYVGDAPKKYASRAKGPLRPGAADGCFLLCNVMRGERPSTGGDSYGDYTSTSDDIRPGLNDWEMVVRDNNLIFPHHFVDVSCRTIGINVKRDADGNYLDDNGDIAYDKDGTSINLK